MEGKVAIVTGSSSGIGQRVAVHLASLGVKVVVTGRNEENIAVTREQCLTAGSSPDHIHAVTCDLNKEEDMERLIKSTVDTFGGIHYLVNNAGVMCFPHIEKVTWDEYNTTMNGNVRSAYWMTKLALPYLKKNQGSIVMISSIVGNSAPCFYDVYSMTKAAMNQLTKCLALQFGQFKVRTNAIGPGIVVTPIMEQAQGEQKKALDSILGDGAALTPVGRTGEPQDVANLCEFLLNNDKSSWLNGQSIELDGGFSLVNGLCIREFMHNMKI